MKRIHYHFNSKLARLFRWISKKPKTATFAFTIGCHTFVSGKAIGSRLRAHEYAHTLQAERGVLRFLFRYAKAHLKWGYQDNPFEVGARVYEEKEYRKFPSLKAK